MKKRILSVIMSAVIAASALSATAFAAPETDPDYILNVGDTVEPYNFDGDYCGYRFEIIAVKTTEKDIYYTMRLIGSDYDVIVRVSDTDLWDMGFGFWRADE